MAEVNPYDTAMNLGNRVQSLTSYRLLGRTGLRVSPIAFGAGTFGSAWGKDWSSGEKEARQILERYIDAGGNFLDTADVYQNGESEVWTGRFVREMKVRELVVLSSKGTQSTRPGDPNAGGNGRKHILKAVDASLQRFGTDYLDLYMMHHWDTVTPVEEVVSTLNNLVSQGKIRHYGFSNCPAWYLAQACTLADCKGYERPAAIQNEYSLIVRDVEYEYVEACKHLGVALNAWSPLANGLLSGKYRPDGKGGISGEGRLTRTWVTDPGVDPLAERSVNIVNQLISIAEETGRTPSQIALNWLIRHTTVTSAVIGARTIKQLNENLLALEFELDNKHVDLLDKASAMPELTPYSFHKGAVQSMIHQGVSVTSR